jgi:hypothetical protein
MIYLIRCHVADNAEKACAGRVNVDAGRVTAGPVVSPPGYSSAAARRVRAQTQVARRAEPFEKQLADKHIICGTPDTVIKSLRTILEETRPSILALWVTM